LKPTQPLVLGALSRPPVAERVLDAALGLAGIVNGRVEALHVGEAGDASLEAVARRAKVALRRLSGETEQALLEAMEERGVVAMVVGAGSVPARGHPVSALTRHVIERASKPVAVVPSEGGPFRRLGRLLVPLEGSSSTSEPVLSSLVPLLAEGTEIVVVHVFTEATLPRMLDRPGRDLELLGREFLAIHCPPATVIELRSGPPAAAVAAATREHDVDLVALSWRQDSSRGRAAVVREVLRKSRLPVLLVPAAPRGSRASHARESSATS
jgi:nucleotide-binding universal stress UspA family protein